MVPAPVPPLDREARLDDPLLIVDPHVGGHRADLAEGGGDLRARVGKRVGDLRVVDPGAVVDRVATGDGVVAHTLDVPREARERLQALVARVRLPRAADLRQVLGELVNVEPDPRLALRERCQHVAEPTHRDVDVVIDDQLLDGAHAPDVEARPDPRAVSAGDGGAVDVDVLPAAPPSTA